MNSLNNQYQFKDYSGLNNLEDELGPVLINRKSCDRIKEKNNKYFLFGMIPPLGLS